MSTSAEPNTETSSAVWDSPAPFATAHATHFVRELKTSTTALGDEEDDSVLWRGEIAEEFLTGIAPFGGYVIAILINAVRSEVARRGLARFPDPASLSATFLSPGRQGPVDITIKTLRQGGRFLVLAFEVSQLQSSKTVKLIFGTVTMADVRNERGGTDLSGIPPPNLPPQSSCAPSGWHNTRGRPPRNMWALLTTLEPPHGEKEMEEAQLARGWTKWARWTRDGDDVASPESLGFFSDLYGMPAMSKMGAWFPTMDLQIQFRSYPTTPQKYLRIRSASQYTLNGRMDFAVELWSEDGTQLLAVARQMSIRVDAGKRMAKNKAKL